MIYRVSFGFLKIFGEKSQKSKRENLGKNGLLRRDVALRHSEARVPNGTPRVRHGVATIHEG